MNRSGFIRAVNNWFLSSVINKASDVLFRIA